MASEKRVSGETRSLGALRSAQRASVLAVGMLRGIFFKKNHDQERTPVLWASTYNAVETLQQKVKGVFFVRFFLADRRRHLGPAAAAAATYPLAVRAFDMCLDMCLDMC